MKMFSAEYMNETAVEEIKKIDGVYFSESKNSFVTSDQSMEQLIKKYNITTDEEESEEVENYVDHIYTGIEQWIEWNYDGEEANFFGESLMLVDYAECVKLDYEDWNTGEFSFEEGEDWAVEIHETLLREVSIGLQSRLADELIKAIEAGYSWNYLSDAFTSAELKNDYIQKQKENNVE